MNCPINKVVKQARCGKLAFLQGNRVSLPKNGSFSAFSHNKKKEERLERFRHRIATSLDASRKWLLWEITA